MKEYWDSYYEDGSKADVTLIRDEKIPQGLFHLVCNVIVKHHDGSILLMQRDFNKKYGGFYESTAGGSALKGEDKFACIKRELFEETGIKGENFHELSHVISYKSQCHIYNFLLVTDCDKKSIILQKNETISYLWIREEDLKQGIKDGIIVPLIGENLMLDETHYKFFSIVKKID